MIVVTSLEVFNTVYNVAEEIGREVMAKTPKFSVKLIFVTTETRFFQGRKV